MFNDKSILITGGTGSFGQKFVKQFYKILDLEELSFIRDEWKQSEMKMDEDFNTQVEFLGDVRDKDRLCLAMRGVDFGHAAIQNSASSEYNPHEFIKTNVDGATNG